MKSRWDEVKSEERRCTSAKVRRKKIHPRQMLEKSGNALFFQWFVCRVSRKVGLLKRRARSHVLRGEIKNCTPLWREERFKWKWKKLRVPGALFVFRMSKTCVRLWREEHLQVKMSKKCCVCANSWRWDVVKILEVVTRSTLQSQNAQKLTVFDGFGPVLDTSAVVKLHALWREAHLQVKMKKNWRSRSAFWSADVEKLVSWQVSQWISQLVS